MMDSGKNLMRIVHEAHTCSDEGDREIVLPTSVLGGPILDGGGLPVINGNLNWGDGADPTPPAGDTPLVTNSSKLVTNGQDEAVMVIVHTIIRDDVRRKLLLKWALRSVELVELQISQMSENEAMKELIEMGDVQVEQEPE